MDNNNFNMQQPQYDQYGQPMQPMQQPVYSAPAPAKKTPIWPFIVGIIVIAAIVCGVLAPSLLKGSKMSKYNGTYTMTSAETMGVTMSSSDLKTYNIYGTFKFKDGKFDMDMMNIQGKGKVEVKDNQFVLSDSKDTIYADITDDGFSVYQDGVTMYFTKE